MLHLGNYNTSSSRTHVRFQFSTFAAAGGNVAPNSAFEAADLRIYKAADGAAFSATQRSSANGITMTSPFDSLTGVHDVDIDLTDNTDSGFYAAGCLYCVMLCPDETVDSQTITGIVLAYFEIGRPQTDVREFGGTAGTFSGGRPEVNTTHWAGTAVGSALVSANVTQISGDSTAADNLESLLDGTGGVTLVASAFTLTTPITANATQLSGDATAADNAEAFFDGTGYAGTNNVIPTVSVLTGHTAQTGDAYAIVNSGTHGNAALKTLIDAVDNFVDTEVQAIYDRIGAPAGASVSADVAAIKAETAASAIRTAVGLASANLDTQLGAIAGYIDTEVGAIYSRVGAPAGASIAADIAAIKAQTDKLGSPAAGGSITLVDLIEADKYIDTTQTPWDLVLTKKGTGAPSTMGGSGTVLLRQDIKDTSGTNITSTDDIPGRLIGA